MSAVDPAEAGPRWLQHSRRHPCEPEPLYRALRSAVAMPGAPPVLETAPPALPADAPWISVITCSIDPRKFATLRASLDARLFGHEVIHVPDARSLAEGFTRGLQRARADRVLFCHDDIRVLAPDFTARLHDYLHRYDLVGVAGSTRMSGPAALWSGPPHGHGWIVYRDPDGRQSLAVSSPARAVVEGAQVLDGVFLAGQRALFETLRWDADTFDGFHGYDVDFSWRAHLAGARVAIAQDLMIEHASRGHFADAWQRHADRFVAKFRDHPFRPAHDGPNAVEVPVTDDAHAVRALGWLRHWAEQAE